MTRSFCIVLFAIPAVGVQTVPAPRWKEFSIGPAGGNNTSTNGFGIRSEGITFRSAIAHAYEIQQSRVLGPDWLSYDRYAMTAVVDPSQKDAFRGLPRRSSPSDSTWLPIARNASL